MKQSTPGAQRRGCFAGCAERLPFPGKAGIMPCKQKEKVMRFDVHNDGSGGTGGRHYPAADRLRRGGGADGGSQRFLRYDHRAQHRGADLHGAVRRHGVDVSEAYRRKAGRAAHRRVHGVQPGDHQPAGAVRPARADGAVRGVPDGAGGVLFVLRQAGKDAAQPDGWAGVQRILWMLRRGVHHRRPHDGTVFRGCRQRQGDVCGEHAVPVHGDESHQLHHAGGAGLLPRGAAAGGRGEHCVHTGGAVDRHTAEPEDVRRCGAAGGVHRRRRQRPGDAGAGAAEVACCVCKNRKACHCRAGAYIGAAIRFQNAQSLLSHPRVRHTARIRKKFRQRKIPPQMRWDLVETAGLEPVTSCV